MDVMDEVLPVRVLRAGENWPELWASLDDLIAARARQNTPAGIGYAVEE